MSAHTETPRKVLPSEHEEGRPVVYNVSGIGWWWQVGTQGGGCIRVGTGGWCTMWVPVQYLAGLAIPVQYLARPGHTRTVPRHGLYRTLYPGLPLPDSLPRLALDAPAWP